MPMACASHPLVAVSAVLAGGFGRTTPAAAAGATEASLAASGGTTEATAAAAAGATEATTRTGSSPATTCPARRTRPSG
jgi:hypothetical protein